MRIEHWRKYVSTATVGFSMVPWWFHEVCKGAVSVPSFHLGAVGVVVDLEPIEPGEFLEEIEKPVDLFLRIPSRKLLADQNRAGVYIGISRSPLFLFQPDNRMEGITARLHRHLAQKAITTGPERIGQREDFRDRLQCKGFVNVAGTQHSSVDGMQAHGEFRGVHPAQLGDIRRQAAAAEAGLRTGEGLLNTPFESRVGFDRLRRHYQLGFPFWIPGSRPLCSNTARRARFYITTPIRFHKPHQFALRLESNPSENHRPRAISPTPLEVGARSECTGTASRRSERFSGSTRCQASPAPAQYRGPGPVGRGGKALLLPHPLQRQRIPVLRAVPPGETARKAAGPIILNVAARPFQKRPMKPAYRASSRCRKTRSQSWITYQDKRVSHGL